MASADITDLAEANRYTRRVYLPDFSAGFRHAAQEEGSAFAAYVGCDLSHILREQHERVVGNDNCVSFEGLKLQIPKGRAHLHHVRVKVRVLGHPDGRLAIFRGPRRLARYDAKVVVTQSNIQVAA